MTRRNMCIDTNPALVTMAAGQGSRYGGLKQIDPRGWFGGQACFVGCAATREIGNA